MADEAVRLDPRLEELGLWPGFGTHYVAALAERLNELLAPAYVALVEERVYVSWEAPQPASYRPDVNVVRPHGQAETPRQPAVALRPAEPVRVALALPEEVRERFVEVRTVAGELVTVVEMLSPNAKRGGHEGRTMYLARRERLLLAGVNLVELDFLLNGERMPIASPWPPGDRFVLVARKTSPGSAEIYPVMKTEPLPAIRFPLRPPDPDAIVDLQQVLQTAWQRGHYDRVLKLARRVEPPG